MDLLDKCLKRMTGSKDYIYFKQLLSKIIDGNSIPAELLETIPKTVIAAGKTRFDQLYDMAMYLVFPRYKEETLKKLLGPEVEIKNNIKIWRIMLPDSFKMSHVLIRAHSYQSAFALGCDYACRMSLRIYGKIPTDMTIRVQFVSEKAIRRMLNLRWANRANKRKNLQLVGREYTGKELIGARLAAVGHPKQQHYSIARYAENKDLKRLLSKKDVARVSSVETEIFNKPKINEEED
jgi:hypothetical protein